MKKTFNRAKGTPKPDIYQRVTDIILAQLEKGTVPWKSSNIATVGYPRNFLTKNPYQGINVFLLSLFRYSSPWFLTYRQAQQLDGQVRKGEKGHLIVKCGLIEKETHETHPNNGNGEVATETRGYLRAYTVFNSCQIDGIDFPETKHPDYQPSENVARAKEIITGMPNPPKVEEGPHALPHYQPKADLVGIPAREAFASEEDFYSVLFHEFTHATGHASRLARKTLLENEGIMAAGTARQTYAKEELVAEMGAAFLNAHAGIVSDHHENSAAYLQSWLRVFKIKANRRWIVEAASQAQKSTSLIMTEMNPIHR